MSFSSYKGIFNVFLCHLFYFIPFQILPVFVSFLQSSSLFVLQSLFFRFRFYIFFSSNYLFDPLNFTIIIYEEKSISHYRVLYNMGSCPLIINLNAFLRLYKMHSPYNFLIYKSLCLREINITYLLTYSYNVGQYYYQV